MYREYRIPALAAALALSILLALGLSLSPAHARLAPTAGAGVGDFTGDGRSGLVPAPSTSTATPIVCNSGTPGPWVEASPNPIDLHLAGVTNDGTYAYAAGGYSYSAGGYINHFTRYDPVANAWATLSPMPDANGQSGTVYSPINNKVYVFGGETGANISLNNTRIYDVAAGTWAAGPPMPDVRANFAAAVYNPANNKIYLIGGTSGPAPASVQAQVWEYDPLAGTFTTTRRPIPQALGGSGYGVYNGHIYVAAGFDASATVSALTFDYNIAADTWTAKADMPTPVADPGSSIVNGKLWVYGGETSLTQAHAVVNAPACPQAGGTMIYDLAADTWSNGPPFYVGRSLTSGTTVGDYTVVV
ncbi:MAG: hypothetical protein M3021_00740, partial [Actinomycetota bacterium]|nr:hypothetical protein [Actinomycetota bacterium]